MMQRKDYSSFIKGLAGKTPTLFIYGDKDKFNPIEGVNAIIEEFQGIEIKIIPDTGHNSFIEKPEQTADVLCSFIDSNR